MFNLDGIREQVFRFLGIDTLLDNLSGYLEARIAQVRQDIRNEIAKQLAKMVMVLVLVLLVLVLLVLVLLVEPLELFQKNMAYMNL